MSRLSNEARKLSQSKGIGEMSEMLSSTKSYITIGDLRKKRKRNRASRKNNLRK